MIELGLELDVGGIRSSATPTESCNMTHF